MRIVLSVALVILLSFAALLGYRTAQLPSAVAPPPSAAHVALDETAPPRHLADLIRFQTVAAADARLLAGDEWLALHQYLQGAYPGVHANLGWEPVGDYSLLYQWSGRNPALAPVLLVARLDVPPVPPAAEARWHHPPFAGAVADGAVWGRGARGSKAELAGLFEALETLIRQEYQPERTILLALGHDDGTGGLGGAAALTETLRGRGVTPEYIVAGGGGFILRNLVPDMTAPVALVAVADGGLLEVQLESVGETGPAARRLSPVARLGGALRDLESAPRALGIAPPVDATLAALAPHLPLRERVLVANRWLFNHLLARRLARGAATAGWARTDIAPRSILAGERADVPPETARAIVRFRLPPGQTIEAVLDRAGAAVADPRVVMQALPARLEPTVPSPIDHPGYRVIAAAIQATFPSAVVAPGLALAPPSPPHYAGLGAPIYRFSPLWLDPTTLQQPTGSDERLPVGELADAVRYYVRLVRGIGGP